MPEQPSDPDPAGGVSREVPVSHLEDELRDMSYPVYREEVLSGIRNVQVDYGNGRVPLSNLVENVASDSFETVEDLVSEIEAELPVDVGDDGDGN